MDRIIRKQFRRSSGSGTPHQVEGMAFIAFRSLTAGEMTRATKALEKEGIANVKIAKVRLSRTDMKRMDKGQDASIQARVVPEVQGTDGPTLEEALRDAKARGDAIKRDLLAGPEMLNTASIAERLGMSGEGIRQKRKRREILGVDFAKRGFRYPDWQILENRRLLPALPQLFASLGDDSWSVYRFLLQSHAELGGRRALDALRQGRVDDVLAAAANTAAGAFS